MTAATAAGSAQGAMGPVRPLALVAVATAALDVLILAVLHLVQPQVAVATQPTSDYVHGSLGVLSPVATAAVGVGAICLALAGWLAVSGGAARVGVVLLELFGAAKVVQAGFPIDAPGESTASGTIHNLLGNLAFFVLPVAAALFTGAVARASGHDRPRWLPVVVGWLLVVLTVLVLAGDAGGWFRLAQRGYLIGAAAWTATVAAWLAWPRRGFSSD